MGGMSLGQRIFFGILAFFVAEQILISTVVWYQTDPAAVAAYAARADLRILSDNQHRAMGEESSSYQSCEKQRFLYVYQGLMCISRMFEIQNKSQVCSSDDCPELDAITIHYWAPHSILMPFKGSQLGYYYETRAAWGFWSMDVETREVLRRTK